MTDHATLPRTSVNRVTFRDALQRVAQVEALNFALTNGIPRQLATRFMGWLSQREQPLVRDVSLATWRMFTDIDLSEAKTQQFRSLHDCFIRELKPGARPIAADRQLLVSPCDGIVGAHGRVDGDRLFQAKNSSYTLQELLLDPSLADRYRDGSYVTLRLTSAMYHRFHAPHDCTIEHVTYVAGDTWNTNPITVKRVPKLYCKNERAILHTRLHETGDLLALVPVAAILVASIRLHCLDVLLHLKHAGPNDFAVKAEYEKGQELGYFQHGSTVVMFAPPGYRLSDNIKPGATVKMGEPLLWLPTRR